MLKSPIFIQKGDSVGIVAPAGVITTDLAPAIQKIESWGIKAVVGKHVYTQNFQFAGTDAQRIADFQEMLDNSEITAILCARGGYGTTRIIDQIDFSAFMEKPKWIAGYSDITTLHCHLHRRGVQSIHSIMPLTFGPEETEASVESLRRVLFGEPVQYNVPAHLLNITGEAAAPIIGGNLALLTSIIGTASDIDTAGKILFIEDINEYLYNIDRMMIQLKRSGKLDKLAGLIVGHFTDIKDNETPFGKTAQEIVADAIQDYHYPVCFRFPIGHEPSNLAIACGRRAHLAIHSTGVSLEFEKLNV